MDECLDGYQKRESEHLKMTFKGGDALRVVGNEPRSPVPTARALYLWATSPGLFPWWFEGGWADTALSPTYDLTYDSIFQRALLYF